jgi:small nuclear ribonucleoprotein (snRNP)-like protein
MSRRPPRSAAGRLIYSPRPHCGGGGGAPPRGPPPPRSGAPPQDKKRARKKRLPRTHRTLAVLLEAVRDERLVFELKDGTSVAGALYEVDANLNAHLSDATVTRRDGSARRLEATYVNGSSVLYVLFPDRVDALRSLDRYLDSKVRVERTETRAKRAAPAAADRPPAAPAISLPAPAVMRGHDRPEI